MNLAASPFPMADETRLADWLLRLPLLPRLLASLCAGAALPLAFAPYDVWWVALLSPALLFALVYRQSGWRSFWLAEAYGTGLWCTGAFWLYTSIHQFGDTPAVLALLMIGFVGVVMGLFNAVSVALSQRFFQGQVLAFTAFWVIAEWCKTWVFTGFPWLFAGYAATSHALGNLAPLGGVFAVSAVLVGLGSTFAALALAPRRYGLLSLLMLGVVVLTVYVGHYRFTQRVNTPPLSVSLIQGNIPQDLKWLTTYRERTLQIYGNLSKSEWGRDLVVWPESSIPMFQTEAMEFIAATRDTARKAHSVWITGIPYLAEEELTPQSDYTPFYNAIVALGDNGHGLYKKQRLVPFGEYVPFEGALKWVLPSLKNDVSMSSFSAGSSDQKPLSVKGQAMAAAICYEVAYPDLTRRNARGSNFLVTVSNDAWFGTSDGPLQHLQMVQMRARETGRWFIRATNTGVSAFIDDQGRIVSRSPQFKVAVLRDQLPAMTGETPYMRWGDLPIMLICMSILMLSALGQWWRTRKRTRR